MREPDDAGRDCNAHPPFLTGSHAMVGLDIIVPDEILPNLPHRPIDRPRATRLWTHPERIGQFS